MGRMNGGHTYSYLYIVSEHLCAYSISCFKLFYWTCHSFCRRNEYVLSKFYCWVRVTEYQFIIWTLFVAILLVLWYWIKLLFTTDEAIAITDANRRMLMCEIMLHPAENIIDECVCGCTPSSSVWSKDLWRIYTRLTGPNVSSQAKATQSY